jgi:cobalt-precorrin-5B (C1)-methyltransferase
MDEYVTVNGRKLKKGYTTGSCAAAASKAAAQMLLSGTVIKSTCIDTPAGVRLTLPVSDAEFTGDAARCSVVKDGGDDPDVTTGLKIFAEVSLVNNPGITVRAGEGIGTVTLPGLRVKPGNPAINPVPMAMILKEAGEFLPEGKGFDILLSVPGGEETAKRTYNPRLGIKGGISILGTSGIVQPMSEEAWKESLALELSILAARGRDTAVLVFGNIGEDFAVNTLKIPPEYIVKISNFAGYMLDKAVDYGFRNVLMAGHIGKLAKVAAGIFHTHSRVADARMEILSSYAALEGAPTEVVSAVYGCIATEAAAAIIEENGLNGVFKRIAENVSKRCKEYTFNRLAAGTVLFASDNRILATDSKAGLILDRIRSEYGK